MDDNNKISDRYEVLIMCPAQKPCFIYLIETVYQACSLVRTQQDRFGRKRGKKAGKQVGWGILKKTLKEEIILILQIQEEARRGQELCPKW